MRKSTVNLRVPLLILLAKIEYIWTIFAQHLWKYFYKRKLVCPTLKAVDGQI